MRSANGRGLSQDRCRNVVVRLVHLWWRSSGSNLKGQIKTQLMMIIDVFISSGRCQRFRCQHFGFRMTGSTPHDRAYPRRKPSLLFSIGRLDNGNLARRPQHTEPSRRSVRPGRELGTESLQKYFRSPSMTIRFTLLYGGKSSEAVVSPTLCLRTPFGLENSRNP